MSEKNLFLAVISSLLISNSINSLHAQTADTIAGTWMARGYGWAVEIDSKTVRIYDITKISCTPSSEYPITMFTGGFSISNKVLTMSRGVTKYTFDQIVELPKPCKQKLSKKEQKNPLYNFDVLWNTFNNHYAYFKERDVAWQKLHDTYRSKINENTKNAELFVICDAMLAELNDGHVSISASDKIMKKAAVIRNLDPRKSPEIGAVRKGIIARYLKHPKRHNISRTIWGKINDSIGYIQLNSMGVQGDYGITDNTSREEAQKLYKNYLSKVQDEMMDDIKGMKVVMKKILQDLSETKKIILDLRFNGGGEDMVGLTVLSHFVNEEKTVFLKKHRIKGSWSEPYSFKLKPVENTYDGELIIAQSSWSASATEALLLASMTYSNIIRIGSPSEGIFSDILEKRLPNGWEFGLSNQVYTNLEDVSYETEGIPVHVDFEYPRNIYDLVEKWKNNLKNGNDPVLEYVINK